MGTCQVPMVVFASGLRPIPGTENEFLVFYGGADTVVAVSRIKVNINTSDQGEDRASSISVGPGNVFANATTLA